MSTDSSSEVTFAILPYVKTVSSKPLEIGDFELWPNTPTEWMVRAGSDNDEFLAMYRDERGEPVRQRASILTRKDRSDFSWEEARDAVYCLSAAAWLKGPSTAEAFMFEKWRVPVPTPPDTMFHRGGKSSINITSADVDKVYPTPYTNRYTFDDSHRELVAWLSQELKKDRKESILTALSHFHLSRFNTPYFTSPGDDIEAMWSGFESLLVIDKFDSRADERFSLIPWPRVRRVIRALVGEEHPQRIGKAEKLRRALREELSSHEGLRPEFWKGVEDWSERFYEIRNHHSHGVRSEPSSMTVEAYELSAYVIAFQLARHILWLRHRGSNMFFESQYIKSLNYLFLTNPVVRRFVGTLRKYDRKEWHPGPAGTQLARKLPQFRQDLYDINQLEKVDRRFRGETSIIEARMKMGLTFSSWLKKLTVAAPANINLDPVAFIPELIKSLDAEKKKPEEIDDRIADELQAHKADEPDSFGVESARKHPSLFLHDGQISIWDWAAAFIRLTQLKRGY